MKNHYLWLYWAKCVNIKENKSDRDVLVMKSVAAYVKYYAMEKEHLVFTSKHNVTEKAWF